MTDREEFDKKVKETADSLLKDDIAKQKIQEKINAQKEELKKERALNRAKANDELAKEHIFSQSEKGIVTLWDEADRKAEEMVSSVAKAYDDWRACMFALIDMYTPMGHAISQSLKETIAVPLMNLGIDWIILPLTDKVRELVTGDPEIDMPALQYLVKMNEEGVLQVDPITRADTNGNLGTFDAAFRIGINGWLDSQGYKPDPANVNQYVHKDTGAHLDKATFDGLKDSDTVEERLDHYLSGFPELKFQARP